MVFVLAACSACKTGKIKIATAKQETKNCDVVDKTLLSGTNGTVYHLIIALVSANTSRIFY